MGIARRTYGAHLLAHVRHAPAAALCRCLLTGVLMGAWLLPLVPQRCRAGDAIELKLPQREAVEEGVSVSAELAPGAPDAAEGGLAPPAGDAVSVASKTGEPQPKELKLPLPEGMVYLEAYQRLEFDRDAGTAILEGDALIVINKLQIEADYIELHERAKNVYLRGNIALQQDDDVIFADEGYYSYDSGEFSLVNLSGNTSGAEIQGTLYFRADEAKGNFDEWDMWRVWITTCPPHCKVYEYELRARKARVRRDDHIMLHHVYIYAREHKILFVPELAIPTRKFKPLRRTESPIQQNFGYNRVEGYFAKFAYTYMNEYSAALAVVLLGVAKLDLTEELGPGVGLRHDFASPLGVTTVRGFYQQDWKGETDAEGVKSNPESNYAFGLQQELNFGDDITGELTIDRENRVTFRQRTNTWNNRFNLSYARPKGRINLSGDQRVSILGGTGVAGQTATESRDTSSRLSFSMDQRINERTSFSLSQNVSGAKVKGGLPANLEGQFQAGLRYSRPDYSLNLRYEEQMDLDGERYPNDMDQQIRCYRPSLEWQIPGSAFGKNTFVNGVTVNLDNVLERRRRQTEVGPALRFKVDTRLGRSFRNSEWSFSPSLNFTQYMYGDGNAQYYLMPGFRLSYTNNEWFKADFSWDRTVQNGVKSPPVASDRRSSQNRSSFSAEFKHDPWWVVRLSSNYDFQRDQWGSLTGSWNLDPSDYLYITHRATYNIENRTFGDLTTNLSYNAPSGNWWVVADLTTKLQGWSINQRPLPLSSLRYGYYRRYKRGWSFKIDANETFGPEGGSGRKGAVFDRVQIQKRSTCTTMNLGYSYSRHEYYLNFFINAFPRYPVELRGEEVHPGEFDFTFSTPTGDIFDLQRGLQGGWGYTGYY